MTLIEIVEIPGDSKNRLAVYVDEDASNPRADMAMMTGYVGITDRQSHHSYIDVIPVHDDVMNLFTAYERLDENLWVYDEGVGTYRHRAGWPEKVEDYVIRYARIFYGAHVEWDDKYGGFWFVDLDGPDGFKANWPELPLHTPEHLAAQALIIKQERLIYEKWAEGDVYGVVHQTLIERVRVERDSDGLVRLPNPLTDDDIDEEWSEDENDGAVWGCYLDDDYTALSVAKEHFDIASFKELS